MTIAHRFCAFLSSILFLLTVLSAPAVFAGSECGVAHPLDPPDPRFDGRCPNCGMSRSMWARTWISFAADQDRYGVCSLHCLADICRKSGQAPRQVRVALYLSPDASVPAEAAFFVVGSRAPGTMTQVSKLAFADREAAEAFSAACGGKVTSWIEAYGTALAGLGAENSAISRMRLKKGNIIEPRDRVDECGVCGMYPARYDRHRCQLRTLSGATVHFCSTQCLFKYLKDPRRYRKDADADPHMAWVTDYVSGRWISARTAYYVIGSRKLGPMGFEAFAFDTRSAAESFRAKNGGDILRFSEVTIEAIFSSP